jgi:transposase
MIAYFFILYNLAASQLIKGLARTRLAKSILDCAWGAFLQILQAVAVKRGKQTVEVSARGSSIECSRASVQY